MQPPTCPPDTTGGTDATVTGPNYDRRSALRGGAVGAFRCYLEAEALPDAVPAARHAARRALADWCLDHMADDTELVLSELVTNGVRATQAAAPPGQRVAVYLALDLDRLFILVWDCCPDQPVRGGPAGGDAENGRGLEIVSVLAERWGTYTPDGGGKVVWAQLGPDPAGGRVMSVSLGTGAQTPERAAAEPCPPRYGSRFQQMQAYEDAICWRTGRLAAPCPDCASARDAKCDDHARDVSLIASYRQAVHQLARAGNGAATGQAVASDSAEVILKGYNHIKPGRRRP